MPLTYQQVIRDGILNALISIYQDPSNAAVLLTSIGFPTHMRPHFADPAAFWAEVCQRIENGALVGGFEALVEAAARQYPANPAFEHYRSSEVDRPRPRTRADQQHEVSIMVNGWDDVASLLETARRIATELGRPAESVNLSFANIEGVLLSLENWTPEQAIPFANRLRTAQPNTQPVQASVAAGAFRDYLFSRLFVEGPDQARFELNDVRASTRVREVAQGVINTQYDPKMFGQDSTGKGGRRVVVDRMKENGKTERLDPEKTLHEQDIRDGDTLHVSPEGRAGSVDPRVREEALVRVRNQVVQYANGHPGFDVSANSSQAPTEYLLQFRARSFAPPGSPKGEPLKIDSHEVFLALPADFPMVAPEAFWQTPIFHPNVHSTAGKVCLGLLGDNFRPGMDFGELCQLLVEIASYRNYAITEGYNLDAQEWAFSDKGQQAIAEIGGRPVIEMLAEELLDWPRERFMKLPSEVQKQLELIRAARSQPTRPFRIKKV